MKPVAFPLLICAVLCIVSVQYAGAENRVTFGGSVGTAAVIYGDKQLTDGTSGFTRLVVEADASVGFLLDPMIRFLIGGVTTCDFRFQGSEHCNLIDYAVYSGIRLYPGLAGLCAGVDYVLGRRSDFIAVGSGQDGVRSTDWGNGFRFLVEYDFTAGGTGFAPVVGCAWRRMPRGTYADNIISLYFRMAYR